MASIRVVRTGLFLVLSIITSSFAVAQQAPAPVAREEHHDHDSKIGTSFTELFVADKIYVQDKGEWYFVLEAVYAKASDEKEYELAFEAIYGLTDNIQLSAEIPWVFIDPDDGDNENGVGDLTLAINWNFIQEQDYAVGVSGTVALPTGDEDDGVGSGQFRYAPALLGALRAGPVELYGSIGGEFGDNHDDIFTYSITAAYPIDDWIPLIELTGESNRDADVLYATPGIYWMGVEGLEFGLGVPIGLTDDSDDYAVVFKFVFEL